MTTLGVTGGIGSGKSAVCSILASLGARVFDADQEARRIMERAPDVRRALLDEFGLETFRPDGTLNRAHLASRVFSNEEELRRLNDIVHPRVFAAFEAARDRGQAEGLEVLVHEAALIFESGADQYLDFVAVVDAPLEVRITRVQARDDASREQVLSRIKHQLPPEALRSKADFVIDNSGPREALREAVIRLYEEVRRRG